MHLCHFAAPLTPVPDPPARRAHRTARSPSATDAQSRAPGGFGALGTGTSQRTGPAARRWPARSHPTHPPCSPCAAPPTPSPACLAGDVFGRWRVGARPRAPRRASLPRSGRVCPAGGHQRRLRPRCPYLLPLTRLEACRVGGVGGLGWQAPARACAAHCGGGVHPPTVASRVTWVLTTAGTTGQRTPRLLRCWPWAPTPALCRGSHSLRAVRCLSPLPPPAASGDSHTARDEDRSCRLEPQRRQTRCCSCRCYCGKESSCCRRSGRRW